MKSLLLTTLSILTLGTAQAAYDCMITFEEPLIVEKIYVSAPAGTDIDSENVPQQYITKVEELNPHVQATSYSSSFSTTDGMKEGIINKTTTLKYTNDLIITDDCNKQILDASNGKICTRDITYNGRTLWTAMLRENSQDREGGMNMLTGNMSVDDKDDVLVVNLGGNKMRPMQDQDQYSSSAITLPKGIDFIKLETGAIVNDFGFNLVLDCLKR